MLVLDHEIEADDVVDLFTKPTRRLLDEQSFAVVSEVGPMLVYCRALSATGSGFAQELASARITMPSEFSTVSPFSEDALTRMELALTSFRTVVSRDLDSVEIVGLVEAPASNLAFAESVAEKFVELLCQQSFADHGHIEHSTTGWVRPEHNVIVFKSSPRKV